jgi:NADH:ubiquinone oxidoreductase subunit
MSSRTFILGSGYSACEKFPLIRDLKESVIHFIEDEHHPLYKALLEPGNGGYPYGRFYDGLNVIDPTGTLGFEEVLIALRRKLENADTFNPCFITRDVLQGGCARLFWSIHNSIQKISPCYEHFAGWLHRQIGPKPDAVVSFNWDILVEKALWESPVPWTYSISNANRVPILKPHGSINWNGHLREGLPSNYPGWKPLAVGSQLCFDASNPFSDPDPQEANPCLRYMLFPGDPDLPNLDPDLKLIWSDIERAISEREELVFLGYSMPDYDSFAARFFMQFGLKHIEVYNPCEEHLARFKTVFGPNVKLFKQTFQDSPYGHAPATIARS